MESISLKQQLQHLLLRHCALILNGTYFAHGELKKDSNAYLMKIRDGRKTVRFYLESVLKVDSLNREIFINEADLVNKED